LKQKDSRVQHTAVDTGNKTDDDRPNRKYKNAGPDNGDSRKAATVFKDVKTMILQDICFGECEHDQIETGARSAHKHI